YQRKLAQNDVPFANVTRTRAGLLDELSSSATCQALLTRVRSQELQRAATAEAEANLDPNGQLATARDVQAKTATNGGTTSAGLPPAPRSGSSYGYGSRNQTRIQSTND